MTFSGEQKCFASCKFAKCESVVRVKRRFCTKYQRKAPTDKTIHAWYSKFEATDCLCDAKRAGRLSLLTGVRETFSRSPRKSTRRASHELQMSQPIVWRILRNRFHIKPYRLQLLHSLSPQDHNLRTLFCVNFQEKLQEDGFAEKVIFSDEATFDIPGKTNRHSVRV